MKRTALALAALAAVAVLGAACGEDDATPASAGAPTTTTAEGEGTTETSAGETTPTTTATEDEGPGGPSDTDAAEARAELAALLDEHTYLSGITITRLVAEGASSPAATAAAGALDDNSVALSEAVSEGFEPEVGEDFLRIWRGHITAYVDYATARVAGDEAGATAATEVLDTFRTETGDLLASASDDALSADDVAEGLEAHVSDTLAAIDATAAGSPTSVALLRQAASHAPDAAASWAAGMFPPEG
jgi:hypothetical protein